MQHVNKSMIFIPALFIAIGVGGCASTAPRQVDESQSITTMDLDIQNFNNAAKDLTNQMLLAPRVQQALAAAQQQDNKLPLVKISRIRNDTGLKVNMVDYLVTPIEEVFTNSGKVDFFSEDQTGQDIAAAQQALGNGSARLPNFVLFGSVSELNTGAQGTEQNAYVFHLKLTDTMTNSVIFVGQKQILKQQNRRGLSF